MSKAMKKPTRKWVVLGYHDMGASGAEYVKTADTYEAAVLLAGKYWQNRGLDFDITRKDPFWVDPKVGYDTNVEITRKRGKIESVMHADGEGPFIEIRLED